MKQINIASNLLKSLALVGLLSACNHENTVTPTQTDGITINDQNAKISPLTRLVKNGSQNIQYIKSGKFIGRVSKISNYYPAGGYMEFTYDDNNPNGDLWIGQKLFVSGGVLQYEWKFKVINGVCVQSINLTDGRFKEYKYTAAGYLDEVKEFNGQGGPLVKIWEYSYGFNVASNTYRLTTITVSQPGQPPISEFNFTYTGTPNKYPLSLDVNGDLLDLPIFGKSSDVLIDEITSQKSFSTTVHKKKFSYTTDSDGLVTSMIKALSKDNAAPYSTETHLLKFSTSWQGI